jgi:DNA polymerase-1
MLAVDTETTGLNWFDGHFPFIATASNYDTDAIYRLVPHPGDDPDNGSVQSDIEAFKRAVLEAEALVFHNAPFDIHTMVEHLGFDLEELLAKPIYDTAIMARVILGEGNWTGSHSGGFGLKDLAAHFIDPDARIPEEHLREAMKSMGIIKKVDQKVVPEGSYYEVWKAYPQVVEEYALKDTRYTYDLYHLLLDKANSDHKRALELEHAVMPELIRMEHRGVRVDPGRAKELYEEYAPLIVELRNRLHESAGSEWDPGSRDDLLAWLDALGVEIKEKTKTGQVSTAAWVLERYVNDHPDVATLLEYRQAEKLMSTYIKPIQDREVVHTSFWQIEARTTRMSSSRPNMQNIPSRRGTEMRSVFLARPGYKLIVADYKSIELRVMAYFVNDDRLMEWITSEDFFLRLGAETYGTEDQSAWPVTRSELKNGVYASIYAAGGDRIAKTIGGGMTKEEGDELKEAIERGLGPAYSNPWKKVGGRWVRRYEDDGMRDVDGFVQRARKTVRKRGYLRTPFGHILRLPPDESYKGPNYIIQGTSAGIMKLGLVRAARALRPLGAHLLLVVHDELVAEAPEDRAEEALAAMREAMVSAADIVPNGKLLLDTSGVICDNYGEAK